MTLKTMARRIVVLAALLIPAGLVPSPASAAPILGLSLLIDGSGSISSGDFALQRTGYINSLTALLPTDGSVALEVLQFSSSPNVQTVFALQGIGVAEKASLLTALAGMTQ